MLPNNIVISLQIENPELSSKLTAPKFSEFLKDFARKEPAFAQNVHDRLTELVRLAKEVSQTCTFITCQGLKLKG